MSTYPRVVGAFLVDGYEHRVVETVRRVYELERLEGHSAMGTGNWRRVDLDGGNTPTASALLDAFGQERSSHIDHLEATMAAEEGHADA